MRRGRGPARRSGALFFCLLLSPLRAEADLVDTSTAATGVRETRIYLPEAVCRNPVGPCAERAIRDSMLLLGRLRECRVDRAKADGLAAAEAQARAKLTAAPPIPYATPPEPEGWAGGWIWAALSAGVVVGAGLSWLARR